MLAMETPKFRTMVFGDTMVKGGGGSQQWRPAAVPRVRRATAAPPWSEVLRALPSGRRRGRGARCAHGGPGAGRGRAVSLCFDGSAALGGQSNQGGVGHGARGGRERVLREWQRVAFWQEHSSCRPCRSRWRAGAIDRVALAPGLRTQRSGPGSSDPYSKKGPRAPGGNL